MQRNKKNAPSVALCFSTHAPPLAGIATAENKEDTQMIKAYLQITMSIAPANRPAGVAVFTKYREPFLSTIDGALTKDLLVREEDIQVLHGFASTEAAQAYLESPLFQEDVFVGLKDLWTEDPDVRIYSVC